MNALFTILTILILIASVLLVIVVLLQSGKDGGLASNFIAGNQTFGVRQTADLLEKVSWGLVAFILVLSIVSTFTLSGNAEGTTQDAVSSEILNQAGSEEAPAFPTTFPQVDPTLPSEPAE